MSAPAYWQQACAQLSATDGCMAGLIARFDGSVLTGRGAPFETLLRAIVGQQISVAAADTIWRRLLLLIDPSSPRSVLAADADRLRQAGLSMRKVDYVCDLARFFASGRLDPLQLAQMDDESVIRQLTEVRGIGRWSAEMFLIFNLQRPDVWPVDDVGLQKALARYYFAGERQAPAVLRELGERWRPWRSVACWFLWRSLDAVEVQY
jgi:DNA-3-methyladenine glycosylase II